MSEFDYVSRLEALTTSLDDFWLIFSGFMVLLMQLGFAFLEAGCVRFKNMQSIMMKVLLNTFIAIICWWACGYGIAFGKGSDFIGKENYGGSGFRFSHHISHWIFQTSVATAANSIVSGGACERMTIPGYALISILFSAFIYPLSIHWAYEGWLFQMGYHDMAGSGVIHLNGAIGALVITYMLKPRHDRYNESKAHEFEPSNTLFIALATLSLYVCWIFFNAGSTLGISDGKAYILGRTACNTLISGASGGITVMILHYYLNKENIKNKFSLVMLCNGNLAGLVAVTGSCDGIDMWAAFVIGIMGGITYVYAAKGFYILKIDDPVDALPIHGACGFIGAIFPGLFDKQYGAFYGKGGHQLIIQLLGIVVWIGWSGGLHFLGVIIIKSFNLLNVSDDDAHKGIDFSQIGGPGYCYDIIPPQDFDVHNSNNNNQENFEIIQNIEISPTKQQPLQSNLVSQRKGYTDGKNFEQEVEMVNNFQV